MSIYAPLYTLIYDTLYTYHVILTHFKSSCDSHFKAHLTLSGSCEHAQKVCSSATCQHPTGELTMGYFGYNRSQWGFNSL